MDKQELIYEKCLAAGCFDDRGQPTEKSKRHHQMFVYERWDVHPPADFVEWNKAAGGGSAITAWNADADRQAFYRWRGTMVQEEFKK